MKYLVLWAPEAERRLDDIWSASADPDRIFRSAMELESRLRVDPISEGESRDGDWRITFEPPLGIYFQIVEPETVLVSMVWDTEKHAR